MKVGSFGFYNGKDLVLINEINDNYVIAISSSRHSFKIPITSSFYEIDQDSLKNIYNDYYNSNNKDLNFSFCHSSKRAFVKFKYNYHYDADITIDNNLNIIDEFSKKYQTKFYKAIAYKYHILNKFNNYNIYYYPTINSYINLLKEIIKNYEDIELINANFKEFDSLDDLNEIYNIIIVANKENIELVYLLLIILKNKSNLVDYYNKLVADLPFADDLYISIYDFVCDDSFNSYPKIGYIEGIIVKKYDIAFYNLVDFVKVSDKELIKFLLENIKDYYDFNDDLRCFAIHSSDQIKKILTSCLLEILPFNDNSDFYYSLKDVLDNTLLIKSVPLNDQIKFLSHSNTDFNYFTKHFITFYKNNFKDTYYYLINDIDFYHNEDELNDFIIKYKDYPILYNALINDYEGQEIIINYDKFNSLFNNFNPSTNTIKLANIIDISTSLDDKTSKEISFCLEIDIYNLKLFSFDFYLNDKEIYFNIDHICSNVKEYCDLIIYLILNNPLVKEKYN